MHEIYAKTKTYLINEIAANARDVLSAIEGTKCRAKVVG